MFTPEMIEEFMESSVRISTTVDTKYSRDLFLQSMADMCNELLKHHKPEGCNFSKAQAEIVRDSLLDEYVAGLIHLAIVEQMQKLPVYNEQLLAQSLDNHQCRSRVLNLELVLASVCGTKPIIDATKFAHTEIDPQSKMMMIAVNPFKCEQYAVDVVKQLKEIPVLVNGERVTN